MTCYSVQLVIQINFLAFTKTIEEAKEAILDFSQGTVRLL